MASKTASPQPRLQIAQILADLSDLNVADPDAALALVTTDSSLSKRRNKSSSTVFPPDASRFDPKSRRRSGTHSMKTPATSLSRGESMESSGSGTETPNPPRSEIDPDLDRASTLMALYEIRAGLQQRENLGLSRARANVAAAGERYGKIWEGRRGVEGSKLLRPPGGK